MSKIKRRLFSCRVKLALKTYFHCEVGTHSFYVEDAEELAKRFILNIFRNVNGYFKVNGEKVEIEKENIKIEKVKE